MFEIGVLADFDPLLGQRCVVDLARGLRMQRVAGFAHGHGDAYQLTAGDDVIPFEASEEIVTGAQPGAYFIRRRILSFGASPVAQRFMGTGSYTFPDAERRLELMGFAIEALLIYGDNYDGAERPDGLVLVEAGGRTFTLADFRDPV
jgi:hypothetical protein